MYLISVKNTILEYQEFYVITHNSIRIGFSFNKLPMIAPQDIEDFCLMKKSTSCIKIFVKCWPEMSL